MAFKNKYFFITGIFLIVGFLSCDNSPSDPEPEESDFPQSVDITAPSASITYWDDKSIACSHNQPKYTEKAMWLVNNEEVACIAGELDTNLAAGEYKITVRIADEVDGKEKVVQQSVTITVKEGFSVSLDRPKANDEFFVGEEVSCAATVTPEKYTDALQVSVGGVDCTDGSVKIAESGELTARAWVTVDNRTESDVITLIAKPVVAGKIYPLTDRGVAFASGFELTLKAGGETHNAQTDADGEFSIKSDRFAELSGHEVTLTVAESSDFYGAKAILTAEELKALIEEDRLGFVLAPKQWQVRCGPMAGKSTSIKLPEAFKRYNPNGTYASYSSFYMLFKVVGKLMYRMLLPKDRPLQVAFNRKESEVAITAADSTSFWQETGQVEEKICRGDLFTPATIDEVPTIRDGVWV
ncbi:MAG: hypothetical protein RI573_16790, partial [Balneolaceae bacterium]|nr:hypothetical protein [Balneolaceae bacterium]